MAMKSNSNPNLVGEQARNWLELPSDITSMILVKLGPIDILSNAQRVCSLWRKICKDPLTWRVVDMCSWSGILGRGYELEKMCWDAVDRTCGQLVDITIGHFGTDQLLHYITQSLSSNQLRRLQLVYCDISPKGLTEAATKLPLLEDLEIFSGTFDVETLETVGRCCPLLKSLKLSCRFFRWQTDDKDALAIAENMPKLRHLQLLGHRLTNMGLQAILNGCPDLESLDLRQCFNLTLEEQLGKKCAERIKNLRLPKDPTDDVPTYDYEFVENFELGTDYYEDYHVGISGSDLLTDGDGNDYEFSGVSDFFDF